MQSANDIRTAITSEFVAQLQSSGKRLWHQPWHNNPTRGRCGASARFEVTREQIIDWLIWNYSNGVYFGMDTRFEGYEPLTLKTARITMGAILARDNQPYEYRMSNVEEKGSECTTWVLAIKRRYNGSSVAFNTREKAYEALVRYVLDHWPEMLPGQNIPDESKEMIRMYFACTGEEYQIVNDALLI